MLDFTLEHLRRLFESREPRWLRHSPRDSAASVRATMTFALTYGGRVGIGHYDSGMP